MAEGVVACPGAYNALVARAVARAGFEVCYVSGGATANGVGVPDIGLVSRETMARTIEQVAGACGLPVVADADTGFGEGPGAVADTVRAYEAAGAAGLHLEDQVFPKRCGHLDGASLVPAATMAGRIAAACEARQDEALLLIARTDARGVEGLEAAIERAGAYRAAGAEMIFPEGLRDEDEFQRFATGSPGLLLANMTEFGRTPFLTTSRFGGLGYDLVIHPVTMQRVAMKAVTRALDELRQRETTEGLLDKMQTRRELYDLLDYDPDGPWPPVAAAPEDDPGSG